MKSEVYESFGRDLLRGKFNLEGDVIMGMLVMGYIPNIANHKNRLDITNEVKELGYEAGGRELSGKAIVRDKLRKSPALKADDLVWGMATIIASGVVLYKKDGALIAYIDFGAPVESVNGEFRVTWDKSGILTMSLT